MFSRFVDEDIVYPKRKPFVVTVFILYILIVTALLITLMMSESENSLWLKYILKDIS